MFYLEIQLSMERNPKGAPMKNLSGSVDMMTSENYTGIFVHPCSPVGEGSATSHEAPGSTREGIVKHLKRSCFIKDPNQKSDKGIFTMIALIFSQSIYFNKCHTSSL